MNKRLSKEEEKDDNARLPLDILWMIITELSDGDAASRNALRNCRLLNRNICAIATPLLFKTLTLHAGLENSTSQMNNLLSSSFELLQHVRILRIPWTSAVPYYHIHGLGLGRPRDDLAVNWTMEVLETNSTRQKNDIKAFEAASWNLFNACRERLEEVIVDAGVPNIDTKVRHYEAMRLDMSTRIIQPLRAPLAGMLLPGLKGMSMTVNDVRDMPRLKPSSPEESIDRFAKNIEHVEKFELKFRKAVEDLEFSRSTSTYRRVARAEHLERLRKHTILQMDNLHELRIDADYQFRDLAVLIAPTPKQHIRKLAIGALKLDNAQQVVAMLRGVRLYLEDFEMWDTTIKQDVTSNPSTVTIDDPWKTVFNALERISVQLIRVRFDHLTDALSGGGTHDSRPQVPRFMIRRPSMRDLSEEEYAAFDSLRAVITRRREEKKIEKDDWLSEWGAWWYQRMERRRKGNQKATTPTNVVPNVAASGQVDDYTPEPYEDRIIPMN